MNGKEYKAKRRLKLCYMVMQDVNHQLFTESVLDEILLSQLGKTIFIVTHDPELIQECCNYFVFMEKGQVKWSDGWNE